MSYAPDHAGALADVTAAGAAVTFTETRHTYDPETDTDTTSTVAVAGAAVRVQGKPKTYEALGLKESEAPTLLFVPSTFGALPALGSTVTWGSVAFTVKDVNPVAPDGTAIMARVVVGR